MAKKPAAPSTKAKAPAAAQAAPAVDTAAMLKSAVDALNTGAAFMASKSDMKTLLEYGAGPLVEFNEAIADGDKIAFRATALGVEVHRNDTGQPPQPAPAMNWTQPAPAPATEPAPAPAAIVSAKTFTFDEGIPVPVARRGGRGSNLYGFEHMPEPKKNEKGELVCSSFFIAASEDNPNPAKRVASTVSSASKRLAPKSFTVRAVDETAAGRGKGARVFRTA